MTKLLSFEKVRKPAQVLRTRLTCIRVAVSKRSTAIAMSMSSAKASQGSLGVSSASESRMLPASDLK